MGIQKAVYLFNRKRTKKKLSLGKVKALL